MHIPGMHWTFPVYLKQFFCCKFCGTIFYAVTQYGFPCVRWRAVQTVVQHKYHRQVFKVPLVLVVILTTARCSRSHWYWWSSFLKLTPILSTGSSWHVHILWEKLRTTCEQLHSNDEGDTNLPSESEYTANVFTNLVNTNQGNDTNAVQ